MSAHTAHAGCRRRRWWALVLGVFALYLVGALAGAAAPSAHEASVVSRLALRTGLLPRLPAGATMPADWWGGTYRTEAGETVRVYVSDYYPLDEAKALGWVDFLAGLVHGRELSRLTLYVAPADVVFRMCGEGALGCYAIEDESITVIGDEVELPDPLSVEQVLAHEYGHHVALNRRNPPWSALERGTKRWASLVGICVRVEEGSAGDRYDRHPAEAFAESYRILVDRARGVPFVWPIVDRSFVPGPKALAAIRQDVLVPWTPTTTRLRGALRPGRGARVLLATPYDGTLGVRAIAGSGLRVEISVTTLTGAPMKKAVGKVTATICGQRHVRLVVRATAGSGRFTLVVTRP